MNKTNIIILIIFILILLVITAIFLFKMYNDKISKVLKRINKTDKTYCERINNKYEITIKLIEIVNNKLKIESKTFEQIKEIENINYSCEKDINKCYEEILDIKDNNAKTKSLKTFNSLLKEYEDNELHMVSLRTYYNKNAVLYNNLIKKFPYNIVSILKKYKMKLLYEGKELEKEENY